MTQAILSQVFEAWGRLHEKRIKPIWTYEIILFYENVYSVLYKKEISKWRWQTKTSRNYWINKENEKFNTKNFDN